MDNGWHATQTLLWAKGFTLLLGFAAAKELPAQHGAPPQGQSHCPGWQFVTGVVPKSTPSDTPSESSSRELT